MNLIFATHNTHKTAELRKIIPEGYTIKSLSELGLYEDIPETGSTLEENALIKARYLYTKSKQPCIADDTGLEVKALGGAPGVYSARYAGEKATFQDNTDKLLTALKNELDREARFRTVIAYIDENAGEHLFEGIVNGRITTTEKGEEGFGYDPVFQPEGYQQTFAQMSASEKNEISHRAKAVRSFIRFLHGQKS